MSDTFEPGDIVSLRGQSLVMTVESTSGGTVATVWTTEHGVQRATFKADTLWMASDTAKAVREWAAANREVKADPERMERLGGMRPSFRFDDEPVRLAVPPIPALLPMWMRKPGG